MEDLPEGITEEEIQKLQQSPSFFADTIILEEDKNPYDYQVDFLEADTNRKVFVAGRQVGKTTTLCWTAIHRAATHPGSNIFILAPSNRQAKNIFDVKLKSEISEWIDNPDQYGIQHETKTELIFSNGSHIQALPAANQSGTGETIRGFTVDLILCDEAAFIDDDFYTSVLKPMLLHSQGDFYLFGTAWGKTGYFYESFNDNRWYSIKVSSLECPDILAKDIEELKDEMTNMEYQREVLAEFTQNKNAAIPAEAIKACTYEGEDIGDVFPEFSGGKCWLGVDPARYGEDRSVYTLLDDEGAVFDVEIEDKSSSPDIKGTIRRLNEAYHFDKILIDATGFGGGPFDDLEESLPNVEGIEFTLKSKQNIYQTLINALEKQRITIPDRKDLISELHDMEMETTPRGRIKFHAPSGGRDDFPDSLALAVWASRGGSPTPKATGVYSMSGRNDSNDRPRHTGKRMRHRVRD